MRSIRVPAGGRIGMSTVVVAAAMVLFSSVTAGQASSGSFWPMKLGNSWTLDTAAANNKMVQTATVTSVKKEGASTLATLDYKTNGQSINTEIYRVTAKSVERMSGGPSGNYKMSPPLPIIRSPMKKGQSWKWSGKIVSGPGPGQTVTATSTLTVHGPENIRTAAGSFKAMKVHSALVVEAMGQKMNMPNDYWFAPGVGIVKQTATLNNVLIEGSLKSYKVK